MNTSLQPLKLLKAEYARKFFLVLLVSAVIFSSLSYVVQPGLLLVIPFISSIIVFMVVENLFLSLISSLTLGIVCSFVFFRVPYQLFGFFIDVITVYKIAFKFSNFHISFWFLCLVAVFSFLGTYVGFMVKKYNKEKILIVVLFLIFSFILINACISFDPAMTRLASQVPASGRYSSDGFLYLRIYYLMKLGSGFYPSILKSFLERAGGGGYPRNLFYWRFPILFYFWKLLPDGSYILLLYSIFSCLTLVGAYHIVKRFAGSWAGIIASFPLIPYFVYGSQGLWFTFAEYWGLFFLVFAMAFHVNGKHLVSSLLLAVSILFRELFVFSLAGLILEGMITRKKKVFIEAIFPFLCYIIMAIIHYFNVEPYVVAGGAARSVSSVYLHFIPYWLFVWNNAHFGIIFFSQRNIMVLLMIIMGVSALIWIMIKFKNFFMAFSAFTPMILFLFMGENSEVYWGIIYLPILLLSSSIVISWFNHRTSP